MITIAPSYTTGYMKLPLSHLHILETGDGPPLIIVPATISLLENWITLAQFMGQWTKAYFFELPGHGESSAFNEPFSSQLVAQLVEQIADELGYKRFNLMGFSFGGILAMRSFMRLSQRIDRLVLIAPCLGCKTLQISPLRQKILGYFNEFIGKPTVRMQFCSLIHNRLTVVAVVKLLRAMGKIENTIPLDKRLLKTGEQTICVLNAQLREILSTEFPRATPKFENPCYFAMSIYDPLLKFDATLETVEQSFADLTTFRLQYPFHQPPEPFTFEELNRDFGETVAKFL